MFKRHQSAILFRLDGKVQGVGMRKFVKHTADNLKLNGVVWNSPYESVFAFVVGTDSGLFKFQRTLLEERAKNIRRLSPNVPKSKLDGLDTVKEFKVISAPEDEPKLAKALYTLAGENWRYAEEGEALASFSAFMEELGNGSEFERRQAEFAVGHLGKKFPALKADFRKVYANNVDVRDLPHAIVGKAAIYGGLKGISSFRAMMAFRTRKQLLMPNGHAYEWLVNNKLSAYEFVDLLGVKRPATKDKTYEVKTTPKLNNKAIKPVRGVSSTGVFQMKTPNDIFEVRTGQHFDQFGAMKEQMRKLLKSKQVKDDQWIVEELVYGDSKAKTPPTDLKFLCFYGKVMLVREIERSPETLDCWWNSELQKVDVGISFNADKVLEGNGPSKAMLDYAAKLSREIPVPFVRLDFLVSDGELVFNEITPRPGSFARFNAEYDRLLGDAFLKAESRLTNDLLKGAEFAAFKKFTNF